MKHLRTAALNRMDLVVAGKLEPAPDKTEAAAQKRLWRGKNFGKITLDIS